VSCRRSSPAGTGPGRTGANPDRAGFLTDSSTFIVERGHPGNPRLLCRAGAALANPRHLLYRKEPTPGAATARLSGEFLRPQRGQQLTGRFFRGRDGDPPYIDATRGAAPA
jgi:hypothetical protein